MLDKNARFAIPPVLLKCGLYLLLIVILHPIGANSASRWDCREHLSHIPVALDSLPDGYVTLEKNSIALASSDVPSQRSYADVRAWSCSQNSVARAMILVSGMPLLDTDAQYLRFFHTVPKSLGPYLDHGFDPYFSYSSHLAEVLHTGLTYLGVAGLLQNAAVAFSINFGLSVCWLKEYMNFFRHSIGRSDLLFETFISHDFNEVLANIRGAIKNGNAVIPMVIYDLQTWHYLNIVGFNNDTVLILDTDSKLYIWRNEELECLMNTGLQSKFTGLDELITTTLATLANQITPMKNYNLLLVTQVAMSTLKRSLQVF